MIEQENVLVISYPSGGFGNFIYHLLSAYADNTVKIGGHKFNFSSTGNSHNNKRYTDPIKQLSSDYKIQFQDSKNLHLVTYDPGINNKQDKFLKLKKYFPNAKIVNCHLTDAIRPVIYKTFMIKAHNKNPVNHSIKTVEQNWQTCSDYTIRENFTLFYNQWSWHWPALSQNGVINFNLESFITNPFYTLNQLIESTGGKLINKNKCKKTLQEWYKSNFKYFEIYWLCKELERSLDNFENFNLEYVKDLHDQGYLNHWIETKYNIQIPVYNYRHWFKNTEQILQMVQNEKKSSCNQ